MVGLMGLLLHRLFTGEYRLLSFSVNWIGLGRAGLSGRIEGEKGVRQ